jgi:mRNA interferase RelE/StbE
MGLYKIIFSALAQKELEKIPQKIQIQILKRIKNLASNPRPYGYKKLINYPGYRIRHGDYRIIYTIRDKELVVWIVKIEKREEVYLAREEKTEYNTGKLKNH